MNIFKFSELKLGVESRMGREGGRGGRHGSRRGKGNQGVCFLIYSCPRDEEDERTRSEAAGVLAQLTSPWIEGGLNPASVEEHAYDMVSSLTQLSGSTRYRVYQKTIEH